MPDIKTIAEHVLGYQRRGLRLFASSSFQTRSVVLLHILSAIDRSIPIYFLQTGYHFPETIAYKDQIAASFGLNVIDLHSYTPKCMQKDDRGLLLFASDPDHCCYLNKVQPMEPLLNKMDVWINGIRNGQTAHRARLQLEEDTPQGCLRYHPIIDWTDELLNQYSVEHRLPRHPLKDRGYTSVGCEPCTRKPDLESAESRRESGWFGMQETECGMHTDLVRRS